jgi:hypothetical protein
MLALFAVLLTGQVPAAAARSTAATPRATGGIGIRLVDIPRDAASDPRARAYIVDQLAPGTTIHRRIEVSNSTTTPQLVTLYADGAAIVGDSFVPAAEDELSGWISVTPPRTALAPGASAIANVDLTVPRTASAGERYATVWAQVEVPSSPSHPVAQINRVGIRVYLEVSGDAVPSDFRIGTIAAAPGAHGATVLRAQVINTGKRAVDVSGTLALASADNTIHAGPYRPDAVLTLQPGGSGDSVVTVARALPAGEWKATLTLASGTITHTATATITIGPAIALVAKPLARSDHTQTAALLTGGLVLK